MPASLMIGCHLSISALVRRRARRRSADPAAGSADRGEQALRTADRPSRRGRPRRACRSLPAAYPSAPTARTTSRLDAGRARLVDGRNFGRGLEPLVGGHRESADIAALDVGQRGDGLVEREIDVPRGDVANDVGGA